MQILKCFHSELMCSVASNYHEILKRLGCLSDELDWHPRKHLWRNSFFKNVASFNHAPLLRTEFLCISTSFEVLKSVSRPKSSRIEY